MKISFNTYDLTYSVQDGDSSYLVKYRWLSNGCYKVLMRDSSGDYWPYTGPKVSAILSGVVSFTH